MRFIKYGIDMSKIALCKVISIIMKFNKNNRDIWLIGERKDEAKDNGYHLFKYIRSNHPEQKIYYIIEKKSNDVKKIEQYKNIIYYDSFKHYLYYVMSTKLICAHQSSTVPSSPVCWKLLDYKLFKKKKIYIKHGIIKEKIKSHMYENTKFDMIVCGAKPEYDFVKSELGYPVESVKYLGLCRFDNLHNFNVKNQILVMPTWRAWFGSTWGKEDDDDFLESDYFKNYQALITNKKLEKYLEENDTELIFYPHYEMQRYLKYFKTDSKKIIIADSKKYDVQQLLKESKLLITDYSSVAFDFAYMKKPIIYYQFDKEEYDSKHYAKGYFEYERDGFGPVLKEIDEVVDEIYKSNKNENLYCEKIDSFFKLRDDNNCYRHFNEIKKII